MKRNKYIVIIISILCLIFSFGFAYIKLNDIIWTNTVQISSGIKGFGLTQSIALQPDNSLSFAWKQSIGDPGSKLSEIYYCEYSNGNVTTAQNISDTSSSLLNPVIISDKEGTIHAVWGKQDLPSQDIFYAFKKEGTWSKPVSIFHSDSTMNGGFGMNIKLKCDNNNTLYIIWALNDLYGYRLRFGIIKNSEIINATFMDLAFNYFDFLVDENNIIHLAGIGPKWRSNTDILNKKNNEMNSVFYSRSTDSGTTWSKEILVNLSGNYPAYGIRILKDGNSLIHIIWGKDRKAQGAPDCLYHSLSTDGTVWSEPKIIGGNSGGYILYDPIVEMDSKNHMHLFWTWTKVFIDLPFQLNYSFYDGSNWTEPISIKENGSNPQICIDTRDILHMIYFDQLKSVSPEYIVKWFYMHSVNPVTKVQIKDRTPVRYILKQNYPNPFNPTTVISYQLSVNGFVTLKVYDMLGREVRTLVNENREAGEHSVQFNALGLSSGTYLYRLTVQPADGSKTITINKSMQILK
jgi:hypothetical protein